MHSIKASVLHGRARVVLDQQEGQGVGLKIRLQTQEWRNQSVLLRVLLTEKIGLLLVRYLKRDDTNFTFEGEKLNEDETAEDMDLEEGKIIEVHIKPSDFIE